MSEAALSLAGVVRAFRQAQGRLEVLKGADLAVAPGEMVALIGPSGAGKSRGITDSCSRRTESISSRNRSASFRERSACSAVKADSISGVSRKMNSPPGSRVTYECKPCEMNLARRIMPPGRQAPTIGSSG